MVSQEKRAFISQTVKRILGLNKSLDASLGLLHLYFDQQGAGEELAGEDLNAARALVKAAFTRKAKIGLGMTDWKPKTRLKPGVKGNAVATAIVRSYSQGDSWDATLKRIYTLLPSVKTWGIKKTDILEAISILSQDETIDITELVEIAESLP